jgi:hypothetical protein
VLGTKGGGGHFKSQELDLVGQSIISYQQQIFFPNESV